MTIRLGCALGAAVIAVGASGCAAEVTADPESAVSEQASAEHTSEAQARWACDADDSGGFITDPSKPIPGATLEETAAALPFSQDFEVSESGSKGTVTWRDDGGLIWQEYRYSHDDEGWWLEGGRSCYSIR